MTITLFYLKSCPYCHKALQYIEELKVENPNYQSINIVKIEEKEQADIADTYDYYYVPCFYKEHKKLHEGAICKDDMIKMFDNLLTN